MKNKNFFVRDAKWICLSVLFVFLVFPVSASAQTVINPTVAASNCASCKIAKIERLKNSTVVTLEYKKMLADDVQGWAMIGSEIYLVDKKTNVQYMITGLGDAKELDKQYPTTDAIGTVYVFKLLFPKLPATIKTLDIIEPGDDGWRFEGINILKGMPPKQQTSKTIYANPATE